MLLNNKKIGESDYEPTVLKKFSSVLPFDEVFLLQIYPYGSSYATQGNLQFFGVKKDGSSDLSTVIEYDLGDDPVATLTDGRIDLVLPGGRGHRGGYAPSQVWTYKNGKLSCLVSPTDSIFDYDNRFDLIVRPSTVTAHVGEKVILYYVIRNNVSAPLEFGLICPPWVTDKEMIQPLPDPACAHPEEIAMSHGFQIGPFGYSVGEMEFIVANKGARTGKFKVGFQAAPYHSFAGTKWSNEVQLNLK